MHHVPQKIGCCPPWSVVNYGYYVLYVLLVSATNRMRKHFFEKEGCQMKLVSLLPNSIYFYDIVTFLWTMF